MVLTETVVVGQEERVMQPLPLDIKARARLTREMREVTALTVAPTTLPAEVVARARLAKMELTALKQMVGQD
jgi:hypothetical protein